MVEVEVVVEVVEVVEVVVVVDVVEVEHLVCPSLPPQHVASELVPGGGEHVAGRHPRHRQQPRRRGELVTVRQAQHQQRGDQLGEGEEQLVRQLVVEVIVEVAPGGPEGVVVRVDGGEEEQGQPGPEPAPQVEGGEVPGGGGGGGGGSGGECRRGT